MKKWTKRILLYLIIANIMLASIVQLAPLIFNNFSFITDSKNIRDKDIVFDKPIKNSDYSSYNLTLPFNFTDQYSWKTTVSDSIAIGDTTDDDTNEVALFMYSDLGARGLILDIAPNNKFKILANFTWIGWTNPFTSSVTIGDADNDNLNEVIFTRNAASSGYVSMYEYNDVLEQFYLDHEFSYAVAKKTAVGDLDGDGDNELVISNGGMSYSGRTKIYEYNESQDQFDLLFTNSGSSDYGDTHSIELMDIDSDNRLEVVYGSANLVIIDYDIESSSYVQIDPPEPDNNYYCWVDSGDLNQNGIPELFYQLRDERILYVIENSTSGFNTLQTINLDPSIQPSFMSVGDLDNDGRLEVIIANKTHFLYYYWDGTKYTLENKIEISYSLDTGNRRLKAKIGDIDDDNIQEIFYLAYTEDLDLIADIIHPIPFWKNNWTDSWDVIWNHRIPITISSGNSMNYEEYQTSTFINKGSVSEGQIRVVNSIGNELMEIPSFIENYNSSHYRVWWQINLDVGQTVNYFIYFGNQSISYRTYEMEDVFTREQEGNTILNYKMDRKNEVAMEFDGNLDYIIIPATSKSETYTFCWWQKRTNNGYVFDAKTGRLIISNGLYTTSGYTDFYDGTWKSFGAKSYTEINKWYHKAIIFNSSESKAYCYIDGVYIGEQPYASKDLGGTSVSISDLGPSGIAGSIDEWRIYERSLTINEIRDIMNDSDPTTTDLLVYYSFEGNNATHVMDFSGNNYHGEIFGANENGTLLYDSSKDDNWQAMYFYGVDDYLQNTYNVNTGNEGTFAFWLYMDSSNDGNNVHLIAQGGDVETDRSFDIFKSSYNNRLRFGYSTTSTSSFDEQFDSQDNPISFNKWHHIVWTRDSAQIRLYIDGVNQSITRSSGSPQTGNFRDPFTDQTTVGAAHDGTMSLNGSMDNIYFYNSALDEDEINQLYGGRPVLNGLLDYYNFEDESSSIAIDQHNLDRDLIIYNSYKIPHNRNHGTMINASQPNWNNTNPVPHPFDSSSTFSNDGYREFDGLDDNITVLCLDDEIGSGNYSFSFWYKLNNLDDNQIIVGVYDIEDTGNSREFYISYNATEGKMRARLDRFSNENQDLVSSVEMDTNWHYLALTLNSNNNMVIYIDGVNTGSLSILGDIGDITSTRRLLIGNIWHNGISEGFFNGSLDELRIYERYLSAEEIRAQYERRKYCFIDPTLIRDVFESNLVSYLYWNSTYSNMIVGLAKGDFNGDGIIDIAGNNMDGHTYAFDGLTGTQLWNASARFYNNWRFDIAAVDLNHDGIDEVVAIDPDPSGASGTAYIKAFNGSTGSVIWSQSFGANPYHFDVGDFDNNGYKDDIVVGVSYELDFVRAINSTGDTIWTYSTGGSYNFVSVSDLNNDAHDDVMVITYYANYDGIAINNSGDLLYTIDEAGGRNLFSMADVIDDQTKEFVGAGQGSNVLNIYNNTGDLLWQIPLSSGLAVMDTEHIFGDEKEDIFLCTGDFICAIESETQSVVWNKSISFIIPSDAFDFSSDILIEDINGDEKLEVLSVSNDGYLYILNSATGEIVKKIFIGSGVKFGCIKYFENEEDWRNIVVGTHNGNLLCISLFNEIDSDGDLLYDDEERYIFDTYMNNNDTDNDSLDDGIEVYTYNTDPNDADTDDDSINDGDEVSLGTNPLNRWIYPKPDLNISNVQFSNNILTITVENIGIWSATSIVIYVEIPAESLTVYNNTASPFSLIVSEFTNIIVDLSDYDEYLVGGNTYNLDITLDPMDSVNETNEANNGMTGYQITYTSTNGGSGTDGDGGGGDGGGSSQTTEPDITLIILTLIIVCIAIASVGIVYYKKVQLQRTPQAKKIKKTESRQPPKTIKKPKTKIPEGQMEELSKKLMEALKYCRREHKELSEEVLATDLGVDLETATAMMKLYKKKYKLKRLTFDQFMELDKLSRSVMKYLKNVNQHPSIDDLMIEFNLNVDQAKLILLFIEKMVSKPFQEDFEEYSSEELLEMDVLSREILKVSKGAYQGQDLINLALILDAGIYSIRRALSYISWIEDLIDEIYLSELSDAEIRVIEEKIKSSARSIKNKNLKLNIYTIIQETEYSLKDAYIMVAIYNTITFKELEILLLPSAQKVRLETLARKIYDHKKNGDILGYNPEQLFTLDLENAPLEEIWFAKLHLESRVINEIKLEEQYPEIERLIQEQKFSKAIETLKELRTAANSFGFVNVVQWVYKNLVLCNILIVKKTILELGQKFTRVQLIEISETSGIEDQNLIISTIKEMITKKEIDATYFESTQSIAFNIQPVGKEIDELMKSYDEFEKRDIGKK